MRHIPALDGIRAIAVLLVVADHAYVPGISAGPAVDVFFVLSGFLISSILLEERQRTGGIDVRAFYARRFVRLVPALALTVAAATALSGDGTAALASLAYLSDYGQGLFRDFGPLGHTWSLAVEEHFYLVWPVVLLALAGRRPATVLRVLFAMYLAATAWRCGSEALFGFYASYFRTDSRLSGLVLGSLLASLLRTDIARERTTLGWIAAAVAVGAAFAATAGNSLGFTLGVTIAEATALRLILCIVEEPTPSALTRFLSQPVLVALGRLSYGVYLFHNLLTWSLNNTLHWTAVFAIAASGSIAAAALSYAFIERPLIEWRRHGIRTGPRLSRSAPLFHPATT